MATEIPVQKIPAYGAEFATTALVFTTADDTGMYFKNTGRMLLIGRSLTGAAGAKTATAVAVAGPDSGRAVNKVGSASAALDDFIMGPFQGDLFNQDGEVELLINSAVNFELAVVEFGTGVD